MRWFFRMAVLLVAIVLIGAGVLRQHKVYDADSADFGMLMFHRIREWDLIVDTTFTGIVRQDGKLHATYDRSAPRSKRACPT